VEVRTGGGLGRWERARQVALDIARPHGWDRAGIELLAEVFDAQWWSAAKRSMERELAAGMTPEELRLALAACSGEGKVDLIHGSQSQAERGEAIRHFEDEGQFLVSTEAGGEGINLHRRCHVMVHFDLPWNPMRLVQRIGRLYRYGQERRVIVFNIHAPQTLDADILALMYRSLARKGRSWT